MKRTIIALSLVAVVMFASGRVLAQEAQPKLLPIIVERDYVLHRGDAVVKERDVVLAEIEILLVNYKDRLQVAEAELAEYKKIADKHEADLQKILTKHPELAPAFAEAAEQAVAKLKAQRAELQKKVAIENRNCCCIPRRRSLAMRIHFITMLGGTVEYTVQGRQTLQSRLYFGLARAALFIELGTSKELRRQKFLTEYIVNFDQVQLHIENGYVERQSSLHNILLFRPVDFNREWRCMQQYAKSMHDIGVVMQLHKKYQ